jgi:hypothetical protein
MLLCRSAANLPWCRHFVQSFLSVLASMNETGSIKSLRLPVPSHVLADEAWSNQAVGRKVNAVLVTVSVEVWLV